MLTRDSIRHTIVLDDPFDDPPGLVVPASSPIPTEEQLNVAMMLTCTTPLHHQQTGRIRDDEDLDDFKGMSGEEIERLLKDRQAKAQAQILEMVLRDPLQSRVSLTPCRLATSPMLMCVRLTTYSLCASSIPSRRLMIWKSSSLDSARSSRWLMLRHESETLAHSRSARSSATERTASRSSTPL